MKVGFRCFVLVAIINLIVSCGGGGSNKPSTGGNNDGGVSGVSSDDLNSELEGKLFYYDSESGPAYFFDFKAGTTETIPQTNWLNDKDRFPSSITDFTADPTIDGEQWLLGSKECESFVGAGGCLHVQDKFGNYTGQSLKFDDEVEGAILSRDQSYILVSHDQVDGSKKWRQIYDFNGKSYAEFDTDSTRFGWFVDNRLVFVDFENDRRSFQFTKPLSFDVEYKLQLPEGVGGNGVIGPYSVSPDGKYIAFRLSFEAKDKKRSIWIMDVDTGALNRFLQIGRSRDNISRPRWSPSGKYLAVLSGYKSTPSEPLGDDFPERDNPIFWLEQEDSSLFIISTDEMMNKTYIVSKEGDRSQEVIELRQRLLDSNVVTRAFKGFGGFSWVE